MKKIYQKPSVKAKKVNMNLLFMERSIFDSVNEFLPLDNQVYASTGCSSASGGICVMKGTKILMAYGKEVNIEDIKEGDKVISYDLIAKKYLKNVVKQYIKNHDDKLGFEYIIINNSLRLTPNHHIWINGKVWGEAKSIKLDDYLLNVSGEKVKVEKLERKNHAKDSYNLILEKKEANYFADGILVHNALDGVFAQSFKVS